MDPVCGHRDQAANHPDGGYEQNEGRQRELDRPEGEGYLFVGIGSKNVAQHAPLDNGDARTMLGENCCDLPHHAAELRK
jgi:hypothetical protein